MFDSFTKKISSVLDKLRKSGALTESNIDEALREIRIALLSADVSVEIAKNFVTEVKKKAVGQEIFKSLSPGHTVVKLVRDHLVEVLGSSNNAIDFSKTPTKIMLIGLQGAGKTTTAAKISTMFKKQNKNKTVLMSSVDIYRPAAIDQLRILSNQVGCEFIETNFDISVTDNAKNVLDKAKKNVNDLVILDTAGRLQIDEIKMQELCDLKNVFDPHEILLVADIMTGQESINIARSFHEKLNITGIVLTRVDGDARGGVALSMKAATNIPIKYLCFGEKLDQIEQFHSERIADRILDMGDVMSLIEKAQTSLNQEEIEKSANRLMEGNFNFNDLADNLQKMSSLGGIASIIKYLPQSQKLNDAMKNNAMDDSIIKRNIAIIRSMTNKERKNYKLLDGSRRKRIASGSGTTVQDVNKLVKQYEGMRDMMKKMKEITSGKKGMLDKFKNMKF